MFRDIYAQAKDAIDLKQLKVESARLGTIINYSFQPSVFIAWAKQRGFTIPNELLSMPEGIQVQNDWGSDWGDITIILTKQRTLLLNNSENGKVENIHPSVLGLCPDK